MTAYSSAVIGRFTNGSDAMSRPVASGLVYCRVSSQVSKKMRPLSCKYWTIETTSDKKKQ